MRGEAPIAAAVALLALLAVLGYAVAKYYMASPLPLNSGPGEAALVSREIVFDESHGKWTFFEKKAGGVIYVYGRKTADGVLLTSYHVCGLTTGDAGLAIASAAWETPEGFYVDNLTVEIRLRYGYAWANCGDEVYFKMGRAAKKSIHVAFTLDRITGDRIVVVSAGTGSAAIIKAKPGEWINVTIVFHRSRAAEIYVSTESGQTARGYGERGLPDAFSTIVIWGRLQGNLLVDYIRVKPGLASYQVVQP